MRDHGLKYVPRKRIDNRDVQRHRSSHAVRRFTVVFLLGCFLVMGMIFSGWVRWKQREIVYRTNQLNSSRQDLEERRKQLLMELSRLRSPERIAGKAREDLGMELSDQDDIVLVEEAPETSADAGGDRRQ